MTSRLRPAGAVNSQRRHGSGAAPTSIAAAVLAALYGTSAAADATSAADDIELQKVIVTATRHSVSVQDVPLSITAISGATLEQAGISDIAGLANSTAGVAYVDKGPYGGVSSGTLTIRGLNSVRTSILSLATSIIPPVATYVDETPLFVNLRLIDLDRVEILRGPQGTLYGSGSLGGTLRFVQNAPDLSGFDARGKVSLSKTDHAGSPNEEVEGMLNMPLSPTFAVRLAASYTHDGGFIDQPNLYRLDSAGVPMPTSPGNLLSAPATFGAKQVNSYQYQTERVAALWKPSEDFRAQLSYYHQISDASGYPDNSPQIYGPQSLSLANHILEPTHDTVDVFALTLDYDLGFATMTSASSWSHHRNETVGDLTSLYEQFSFYTPYYGGNPRALFVGHDALDDKPWSEELRFASEPGGMFDWVAGLFYMHQNTNIVDHEFYPGYNDYFKACVPTYGVGSAQCGLGEYFMVVPQVDGVPLLKDQSYIGDIQTRFTDSAAFGEVTWHVTSAFQLTGGVRDFKQKTTQSQQNGLLFDGPSFISNNTLSNSTSRVLGKLNASYKVDETNLIYATWSQGFRRGGVNALPPSTPFGGPVNSMLFTLKPDTANNYEVGVKGTIFNRYQYSAAVYDIEWKDIQQPTLLTPLSIVGSVNLGNGYSRGVEFEFLGNLTEHVSANLSYTYDQTKLTSLSQAALIGLTVLPTIGGRLPGTPEHSAAFGLEYGHVELAGFHMLYGVSGHFQSQITPDVTATIPKAGGYTMWDARVSATRDRWRTTLYVDNLSNVLGIDSYTDPVTFGTNWSGLVSRPRTIGLSLAYSFKGQ